MEIFYRSNNNNKRKIHYSDVVREMEYESYRQKNAKVQAVSSLREEPTFEPQHRVPLSQMQLPLGYWYSTWHNHYYQQTTMMPPTSFSQPIPATLIGSLPPSPQSYSYAQKMPMNGIGFCNSVGCRNVTVKDMICYTCKTTIGCNHAGCDDPALEGKSVCMTHDNSRQKPKLVCEYAGCTTFVTKNHPSCSRHESKGKMCFVDGCINIVQDEKGKKVCAEHNTLAQCKHDGCTNTGYKDGFCKRHLGTPCKHEHCTNRAVGQGVCSDHGAKVICRYRGCRNKAKSTNQACYRHASHYLRK